MRSRRLDDHGGSAIEAALLMAAVALVMLPALFLLGRAVDSAFSKPCDELPSGACASSNGVNGGGGSGGGSGPDGASDPDVARSATRNLESWVLARVPVPTSGTTVVSCDDLDSATPPAGSTTDCEATFDNGDPPQQYVVEWGPDGEPRLKDA